MPRASPRLRIIQPPLGLEVRKPNSKTILLTGNKKRERTKASPILATVQRLTAQSRY